jgi:sec-independent protein translocase protein TatC
MALDPEVEPAHLENEEGGPVKPFLEHLEDLRWVLIKCVSSLVIGMVACMVATPTLITILQRPLVQAGLGNQSISTFGPLGVMSVWMKISFYGGMILALPFILYFIGEFIMPALKNHEKKYFLVAFTVGGGLFLVGVVCCYFFLLQLALVGMIQINKWMNLSSDIWRAEEFFHFEIMFMVGMCLEVPVLILTLVRAGVIPHEWLIKGRRYFFVANLVLCAFITPDFVSTFFIVIPVQILMEICIQISKFWERKKAAASTSLIAAE